MAYFVACYLSIHLFIASSPILLLLFLEVLWIFDWQFLAHFYFGRSGHGALASRHAQFILALSRNCFSAGLRWVIGSIFLGFILRFVRGSHLSIYC